MKKKTKKTLKTISILLILGIIIFLGIIGFTQQTIFGELYTYNKSFSSSNLQIESKSTLPYEPMIQLTGNPAICDPASCLLPYGTAYRLVSGDCYYQGPIYPGENCGNKAYIINQTISANSNSINFNLLIQGTNAKPDSVMYISGTTLFYVINKKFNTDIIESLQLDYHINNGFSGSSYDNGLSIIPSTEFFLSNSERDISLLKLEGDSTGNILISKNPAGIGYIININGIHNNLNIPIGNYQLLIKNYPFNGYDTVNSGSSIYFYNIELTNITFKNAITQITIYRKINNACFPLLINQSEILSTDFMTSESCQNNLSNQSIVNTTCISNHSKKCFNNNVYWYDSCGVKESKFEECGSGNKCVDGKCIFVNCCGYKFEAEICQKILECVVCPTSPLTLEECQAQHPSPKFLNWLSLLLGCSIVILLVVIIIVIKKR